MNKNLDIRKFINNNEIKQGKEYILVFVYAEWCGACKRAKPIFIEKSGQYSENCCFIEKNYEDIPNFNSMGIEAFPTFILFEKNNNDYKMNDKGSGINYLDILIKKIPNGIQHDFLSPKNTMVNVKSKKEFSINKIINDNLKITNVYNNF